jgi:Holliday junction resolvasome RuvABC ATP-dependent DNA helicase subunit
MEWVLAGLFALSVLLLIMSFVSFRKASEARQKEIDMLHITNMNEINELRDMIANIEHDIDIVINKAGIELSTEERKFLRKLLDLHKRKYSIETIAKKMRMPENEIRKILAPYITSKGERRKAANGI